MASLDVLGVALFTVLSVAFYLVRHRLFYFAWVGPVVLALFVILSGRFAQAETGVERVLIFVGLALYWVGLFIIRIILRRSVSLHLLSNYLKDHDETKAHSEIALRLEEAVRYRLAVRNGELYTLTPVGRLIASMVGLLKVVTRTKW